MRGIVAVLGAIALLAGCGPSEAAARRSPAPSLARCPAVKPVDDPEMLQRRRPIPVPPALAGLMVSDRERFAVSTMAGGTICIDASWWEEIGDAKVSHDRRFVAFDWSGYESFGHLVVDRSGKGMALDTGIAPLAPPTGRRFAAIDLSESAFGALNAFGVWQIEPVGLRQLAKIDEGLPGGDWAIDGWASDSCINLSLVPSDRQPDDATALAIIRRDPWFAAEASGWRPRPGRCPT